MSGLESTASHVLGPDFNAEMRFSSIYAVAHAKKMCADQPRITQIRETTAKFGTGNSQYTFQETSA